MRKRRFGRTGYEVSELVFGGGWVGGLLIDKDGEVARQAVQMALDAGIDWIDTAAEYGKGASETAIGGLLPKLSAKPRLSTKVRLDTTRLADLEGEITRSLESSLKRLGVSSVELFFLHNPVVRQATAGGGIGIEEVLRPGGVMDVFDKLRAQGLIGGVGFTAVGETAACIELCQSGRVDAAQVYYNVLNPSAAMEEAPAGWTAHSFAGLLAAIRGADMGVMAIRVLAAGVLATDVRHGREGAMFAGSEIAQEEARARAVRRTLGDAYGTGGQSGIRFALAHPDISCAVVGLAELAHLEEALEGQKLGPLPLEALGRLGQLWAGDYARI